MNYEVVFSGRKTVALCVKDGRLIVRAPYGTGRERIESLVLSHTEWIAKHLERQVAREKRERFTDAEIALLRKSAKEILPLKTARFASIMGLSYNRITITGAKTRFGSCTARGNISFSYRLMTYPEAAIDYVVVHELAHLVEMNHSKRFYAIVEKYLPDYKERRSLLKK